MNPLPIPATPAQVLDVSRDGDHLTMAIYPVAAEPPLRTYETLVVDWPTVDARCRDLGAVLGQVNAGHRSRLEGTLTLRRAGHALFDQLLTPRIKETLARTEPDTLCLAIDERVAHIPWEMLHDGTLFWAERYALGRRVRTRHSVARPADEPRPTPQRVLIVADPRGDLDGAHSEGRQLRDLLTQRLPQPASIQLITSRVTPPQVVDRLRECDLLHYAGHARYHRERPGQGGWLLHDGDLTPELLLPMAGGGRLPSLVFANGCSSGQGIAPADGTPALPDPVPLANAFLLAGARHYLGTAWDIPDAASATFAATFYEALLAGAPIGEAVRSARLACLAEYGEGSVIWASYLLYGDPTVRYFSAAATKPAPTAAGKIQPSTSTSRPRRVAVRSAEGSLAGRRSWLIGASVAMLVGAAVMGAGSLWTGRHSAAPSATADDTRAALLRGIIAESDGATGIAARAYADGLREAPDDPYIRAFANSAGTRLTTPGRAQRIAELIDRIAAYQADSPPTTPDAKWTSQPVTIAVLAIDPQPAPNLPAATAVQVERQLQRLWEVDGRLRLVDRQHLEPVLEELHLTAAKLARGDAALPLGALTSAQLLAVGELIELGDARQVSLRLIETSSSTVVAAATRPFATLAELSSAVAQAAADLTATLRRHYPLRAAVVEVGEPGLTLDIGATLGVTPGTLFRIIDDGATPPIVVRVDRVTAQQAYGQPLTTAGGSVPEIATGSRLEQVWDDAG